MVYAASLTLGMAADADSAWQRIEALDAGPQNSEPKSREQAIQIARDHFFKTRRELESFLVGYPQDPRAFDARLRLASLTATEGAMDGDAAALRRALEEMIALERTDGISPRQLADAMFRRISLQMQTLTGRESEQREVVVTAARNFAARFPSDVRAARLLVEASTICGPVPETMRGLLQRAQTLTREPELHARIADDLRRLDQLGKPLDITLETLDGRRVSTADLRGRIVAIIFWSSESPHSLIWLSKFREQVQRMPVSDVVFLTVSLDENPEAARSAMRALQASWPTQCDGRGWDGELVRSLGINAVPTLWLLDKRGTLRTLNARDTFEVSIRALQRER